MKTVALISGGKDSCFNMMHCVAAGHTIVALANLQPLHKDELDSYMYQTVGHQGIALYAEAMELPLFRESTCGIAVNKTQNYSPSDDDEVEDLYRLLARVKKEILIEAVAVGAILSDYQRIRVENVCSRLGLVCLAYLWRRNQTELLQEMIASGLEAIIIKVAALGLDPHVHLGMAIKDIQPHLLAMQDKYGLNVCGEGGEYETFTLDCPLFKKKLVMDEMQLVIHSNDPIAPVGYLDLKLHLELKPEPVGDFTLPTSVKNPFDFVKDLNDSVFSDLSDIDLSETELESLERLEIEEKSSKDDLASHYVNEKSLSHDIKIIESNTCVLSSNSLKEKEYQCIKDTVPEHGCIFGNRHGWYFIGGIVGEGVDCIKYTEDAMKKLSNLMTSEGLQLSEVCSINLYVRDMSEYSQLNQVYAGYFSFPNPPTRVCVQCPLPSDIGLILDAVAYSAKMDQIDRDNSDVIKERSTMHVQGISHWAPANIGPYSQAVKVGEVICSSGQIALVPGAMRLVEGGARRQCALALRHAGRVIRAAARPPRASLRTVVQSVCYVTEGGAVNEARRQLERRTTGAIVEYAVVSALPRAASVEWAVLAHSDNNRFDYEETGCNVGDYKVAIIRRWNYENTVAAFLCYVATVSSPSSCRLSFPSEEACQEHKALASQVSLQELVEVLEYAVRKLISERQEKEPDPAVKLRIFYQVWSAPPVQRILEALNVARQRICRKLTFTIVPVIALHNAFTFMSISGLTIDE